MAEMIARLKLESGEYDSKIKRAVTGLQQMEAECRKVGGTLAVLEKDQLEFVKGLGQMETVSKSARGKLSELTSAFVEMSLVYKRMTDEEKNSPFGQGLKGSLDQLKTRINDSKKELGDIDKELNGASGSANDWSGALSQLGGQLGINSQLMGVLTSGTIATTAAVTAGAAAVAAATKMWADYNDELNRQTSMTKVVTGLDGSEAEEMTVSVRALAKTYDVDFRQAIDTANTLMHQFGVSGEKAIQLLQDGMQGMIAGDGQKLLSMIQQFAPAFVDAGISADKLVAIIHNSEGGLFSEQNMNAILMGIKNIRLMTKATSDALAQMGIDGEEMSRRMSDGSMTVFEALQQVAEALEQANTGSREAGQVMQQVFGRQGAMQGMKLARAIATLNTNLEQTKVQTGELGQSFVELNRANEQLERTMQEVFGMSGWEDFENKWKTDLANTLNDVIGLLGDVKSAIFDIGTEKGFDSLVNVLSNNLHPLLFGTAALLKEIKGDIADIAGWGDKSTKSLSDRVKGYGDKLRQLTGKDKQQDAFVVRELDGKVVSATSIKNGKSTDVTQEYVQSQNKQTSAPKQTPPKTPKVNTPKQTPQSTEPIIFPEGSLQALEQELKALQQAQKQALDPWEWEAWQGEIDKTTQAIKVFKGEVKSVETPTFDSFSQGVADELRQKELKVDTNTLTTMMQVAIQNGIDGLDVDFEHLWRKIGTSNIEDSTWQELQDLINEKLAELDIEPITIDFKTGNLKTVAKDAKKVDDGFQSAMQSVQSLGSALNNLEDPGAKIAGTVGQAIAQIALGFAQATATTGGTAGVFGWIAAITGGLATMTSTIAAIHNATGYAKGGKVEGPVGIDNVPAWLTAGEIVLNSAQQQNVAQDIMSGNEGGGESGGGIPYVTGETIVLGMNNHLKRSGQGEIVTTGMLKRMKLL